MGITDVLATLFVTQGVSTYVNSFKQAEIAQERLTLAGKKYADAFVAQKGVEQAKLGFLSANLSATKSLQTVTAQYGAIALGVFAGVVNALKEATQSYIAFGIEVANVRDLTGGSALASGRAVSLFRVAGVDDVHAIKDILHLSKTAFSQQGLGALSQIGVSVNQQGSGLTLFNQIADALERYPNGLRKAAIEEEIFGAKGVAAILPLLRLTREQRDAAAALSTTNEEAVDKIVQFQFASGLLGETILQKLVYPIAQRLIPALIWVIDAVSAVAGALGEINQMTGGLLGVVAAFLAIGTAVSVLIGIFRTFIALQKVSVVLDALKAGLMGQWQNLAIGALAAGTAVIAVSAIGGGGSNESALDANTQAVNNNTTALNYMADGFDRLNKGGVPRGLSAFDVQALARSRALMAIG